MPEELDGRRVIAGVGALVLLVSLFLDWFKPGISAWDVFEVLDLVLAAIAIATLAIAVPQAWRALRGPDLSPRLLPVLGIAAFVIVVAALINHPPAAFGQQIDTGAWIALGGSALMAIGGILSAARISVVVSVGPRARAHERPPVRDTGEDPARAPGEEPTRTLERD
jgi:cation transport ATPase